MHRTFGLLGDHRHVLTPHVRADELQAFDGGFRDRAKETTQTFLGSVTGDVQQATAIGVDLVHQRQVFVAAAISDLIDADRFDGPDFTVRQSPADDPVDRAKDGVPTGAEDHRGFLPAESVWPKKPGKDEN